MTFDGDDDVLEAEIEDMESTRGLRPSGSFPSASEVRTASAVALQEAEPGADQHREAVTGECRSIREQWLYGFA